MAQVWQFFNLRHNTLSDGFPHRGHTNHDGGSELTHVTFTVAHGVVGDGLDVGVTYHTTPVEGDELEGQLEDVGKGQERDDTVGFADEAAVGDERDTRDTGKDVAVLQHHTLGITGGTGGVHDARHVLGRRRVGLDAVCGGVAHLDDLVHGVHLDVGTDFLDLVERVARLLVETAVGAVVGGVEGLGVDDVLQVVGLLHGAHETLEQRVVGEDGLGAGLDHGVDEALLAQRVVRGDNGHRLRLRGKVRFHPPVRRGGKDVEAVVAAGGEAHVDEPAAVVVHQGRKLAVRRVAVRRKLVVVPGFLDRGFFAIHDFRDGFLVLVDLDGVTPAHAFAVAALFEALDEILVDGGRLAADGPRQRRVGATRVTTGGGFVLVGGFSDGNGVLGGHGRTNLVDGAKLVDLGLDALRLRCAPVGLLER